MKIDKPDSEPSMDEILASIREIVSSETPEEKRQELLLRREGDILDLTDALPEEEDISANSKEVDIKSKPARTHKGHHTPSHQPQDSSSGEGQTIHEMNTKIEETLVSREAMSEVAQAFYSLNKLAQESPRCTDSRLGGVGGQTLENLVREALKPLLKEWLDTNLPALVRWVVNEQVERIMHQANVGQNERKLEKEKSTACHE